MELTSDFQERNNITLFQESILTIHKFTFQNIIVM